MASQPNLFSVKEFAFTLRFTAGADPVMDLFHEYPTLRLRNGMCTVTENAMWRIDHVDGPADAISALDEVFLDEERCNECLDEHRCSGTREYQVLDRRSAARTVYTYHAHIDRCCAVPAIVTDYIGDGVVFESERTGGGCCRRSKRRSIRWSIVSNQHSVLGYSSMLTIWETVNDGGTRHSPCSHSDCVGSMAVRIRCNRM
ncbi:hypothetical protein [Haloarcula sebkhae]|uniref:Uncharacterized protein n=2 Tax=Haloarcula sebkhae TaxID=932660 RepID=A0ACC6VND9_9EURY|nr:hypothetical protein [Haloarcula sebkhae]GGK73427.1 hypothetical protein GCM10009067_27180 [Haloarcula sebkhae]